MTTLTLVLFIVLVPMCLFLIGLILLQGGAGDISSAFGGGGQLDSTLGVGAGRKMSKITGWLSALFMAIVLILSVQHAGDFGHAAGTPATTLSTGDAPATTLPPVPSSPINTPPSVEQLVVPTSVAPVVPVAPVPAPVDAAVPVPTVPVVPVAPIEKPVVPAPAANVPAAPAVPVVPADKPAAVTDKPAEQPAAPRSGISLDNQQ